MIVVTQKKDGLWYIRFHCTVRNKYQTLTEGFETEQEALDTLERWSNKY